MEFIFYLRSDGKYILVSDTIMVDFFVLLYRVTFLQTVYVLLYLRSDGKYIILGDGVMAVFWLIIIMCDVLIDSEGSVQLKVRRKIYFTLRDAVMVVLLLIIILCDVMLDSGCSFLLNRRWTTQFS